MADQIDMFVGAITVIDRTLPFEVRRLTANTIGITDVACVAATIAVPDVTS